MLSEIHIKNVVKMSTFIILVVWYRYTAGSVNVKAHCHDYLQNNDVHVYNSTSV